MRRSLCLRVWSADKVTAQASEVSEITMAMYERNNTHIHTHAHILSYRISQNMDRRVPWCLFIPPLCWAIRFILQREWASVKSSCLPFDDASRLLFLNSLASPLGREIPPATLLVSVCFSSYMKPYRHRYGCRYEKFRDGECMLCGARKGYCWLIESPLVDPPGCWW